MSDQRRAIMADSYHVFFKASTARLLWQVCRTMSQLSALPPVGRERTRRLGEAFKALANGAAGVNIADDRDGIVAEQLQAAGFADLPGRLIFTVTFTRKTGEPLADGRAQLLQARDTESLKRQAWQAHRELPEGFYTWCYSARPGDELAIYHAETRTLTRCKVADVSEVTDPT